ncbi:small-conductance mechanosensitive channel [Mycobacteroides abscessus subsp. massiliense]|nr:small-conductance mechanosensitive channel [Mycobacteroides abscessus subsp. massiliense]
MRVQAEKEAERERRAELAEQRKAEQELRRERERLEKELAHYSNAIAMLEKNDDYDGVARLRVKLADVVRAIENVDYRQANIRAGFVYVISNIGAFGANMIKIGMTRRLEPMDRVRELGDASVPFRFDVHALFFADDAVLVESQLHQAFADKRVNRVNLRREFFYATPGEVLDVLKDTVGEVVEYNPSPEAEEYRISQGAPDTSL